jgi:UDP-N-acetylglucosamine pyrophosphorylase
MNSRLSPAVIAAMRGQGIDVDLTLKILDRWNAGKYKNIRPIVVEDIPSADGETILDMENFSGHSLPAKEVRGRFAALLPGMAPEDFTGPPPETAKAGLPCCAATEETYFFPRTSLEILGRLLFPLVSFGVLNGGSATSYCDTKKNEALNKTLFDLLRVPFREAAGRAEGKPKGITPAYANPDGSPGYSFLELKMRNLLLETQRCRALAARFGVRPRPGDASPLTPLTPLFQMTSIFTNGDIAAAFREYRNSPLLKSLIAATGIDITQAETGVQPLIAAFTPSSAGERKSVFTRAYGKDGAVLGLPGGHGQNFLVLRDVYRRLRDGGKRFVYLGNVDNLGFTPEPVSLAVLALSGRQAGFDFSFKTAVDTKGGVLVRNEKNRLTCADIGSALAPEEIKRTEKTGRRILFNAATGLFDLDYLVKNLDMFIDGIPMRWSEQDKDAGRYSQAEQVTWEVLGLLDKPLIFGINKFRRFLAAKLLLESLMTSGLELGNSAYPEDPAPEKNLRTLAAALHEGFVWNMENVYGMKRSGGRWEPAEDFK